jgi:FAD dependent oxidoreductase
MPHAVVIGAGFYGCVLAINLKTSGKFDEVTLIEREPNIMSRASDANQHRLHGGYHYPRSEATATRCHINLQRFADAYPDAVVNNFASLYAIAAQGSKTSAGQFRRVCDRIGIPLFSARDRHANLFGLGMIDALYEVREPQYDIGVLRDLIWRQLVDASVLVLLGEQVSHIAWESVTLQSGPVIAVDHVFDCTYSSMCLIRTTQHLAEMVLVAAPTELMGVGITIMDGPFFSVLPDGGGHLLTHVQHTPHRANDLGSNFGLMRADAARYVPCLAGATYVQSIFEVKTLPWGVSHDDARPVVVKSCGTKLTSILGSKITNVFDMLEKVI